MLRHQLHREPGDLFFMRLIRALFNFRPSAAGRRLAFVCSAAGVETHVFYCENFFPLAGCFRLRTCPIVIQLVTNLINYFLPDGLLFDCFDVAYRWLFDMQIWSVRLIIARWKLNFRSLLDSRVWLAAEPAKPHIYRWNLNQSLAVFVQNHCD